MARVQAKRPVAVRQVVRDEQGRLITTGQFEVTNPALPYDTTDAIVQAYPWAFGTLDEVADARQAATEVTSVAVEQATRAPGERRATRRR